MLICAHLEKIPHSRLEVNLLTNFKIFEEKAFIHQMQTGTFRTVSEMKRCPKPEETSRKDPCCGLR